MLLVVLQDAILCDGDGEEGKLLFLLVGLIFRVDIARRSPRRYIDVTTSSFQEHFHVAD